jgi:hypothetical protein
VRAAPGTLDPIRSTGLERRAGAATEARRCR